jgi:hypothetical protein
VLGGLPEFIIEVASSGGISVFGCTLWPAVMANAELNNELPLVYIDTSSIDVTKKEKTVIFSLCITTEDLDLGLPTTK